MFRKEKYIKDFTFGEKISNEIFSIKEFYGIKGDYYKFLLADNTGTILSQIPLSLAKTPDLSTLPLGTVIYASGVIVNEGIERLFSINTTTSVCTEYIPREVFGCISDKVITNCITEIKALISKMDHPGYRSLVEICLTDDVLRCMSSLPATASSYGRYNGACLVATNAVSHMVLTSMTSYTKRGNQISTTNPSWNALTCASLLFLYGNLEYFTPVPPYKRTALGIKMGYVSLLQKMLDDAIQKNNIVLSNMDYANLMSILKIALETKLSLKATSKDGVVLRHIITLYADCDCFDWDIANHEAEEDETHYYSQAVRGYIIPTTES